MPKCRYGIDPHNRLVIKDAAGRTSARLFRRVLDGKFSIGPGNTLIYHIKTPVEHPAASAVLPHQIKLRGRWSLTRDHKLRLTLDKWRRQTYGDKLEISGDIIGAGRDSLAFSVMTRDRSKKDSIYTIKLKGRWQADAANRLTFNAKKEGSRYDTLTLSGMWGLGRSNKIVYVYKKRDSRAGPIITRKFTLNGRWDISKRNRIDYNLDIKGRSAFYFDTSLSCVHHDRMIFEIGAGTRRRADKKKRLITLYGRWAVSPKEGVMFKIEYDNNKVHAIIFGADVKIGHSGELRLRLKNRRGRDLGMEVVIKKSLFRGGTEGYLRALKEGKEFSIAAGMAWGW